jgi:hypothetical protein
LNPAANHVRRHFIAADLIRMDEIFKRDSFMSVGFVA